MITCEICGTQADQHDHWRHLMVARVAALEDFVTREPPATAEQLAERHGFAPVADSGAPSVRGWSSEPAAEQPKAVHLKGCGATLSVRQPRGMCGWIFADGSQSLCAKCKGEEEREELHCEVAVLEARLAQAERERDERGRQVEQMAAHVATMRVERDEARDCGQGGEVCKVPPGCQHHWELRARELLRERNEATARERERCAVVVGTIDAQAALDLMCMHGPGSRESRAFSALYADIVNAKEGISSGKPAPKCDPDPPREVAPDRTPCSELCGSKFIVEARREVIAGDRKSVHERDGHCYSTIACLTARKCVNK